MSKGETGYYDTVLKNWPKQAGSKPTAANFEAAHKMGCRAGKQALAMAMYLRDGGATDGQVKLACIVQWGSSGSHHNKRRDLIGAGLVKVKPVPADSQGHKVYAITLTAKGTAKVEKPAADAKSAKVAKPAKAAKGSGDKPAAPATPTPAPVNQPGQSEPAPANA